MPLFICRWQNGDFSAVSAASRDEAMELLDEVGNADVADVFTVRNFMVHFQLKEEADDVEELVPVELEGFGEETYDILRQRVYPVYSKASDEADEDWPATGEVPKEKRDGLSVAAFQRWHVGVVPSRPSPPLVWARLPASE